MKKPNAFIKVLIPLLPYLFMAACSSSTPSNSSLGTGSTQNGPLPFSGNGLNGSGLSNPILPGSGSGGALTPANEQALQSSVNAAGAFAPATSGLPPELQQAIQQMMAAQAAGQDTSTQQMQIAGQILQNCTANVVPLAPVPGQPLMGNWSGSGASTQSGDTGTCPVSFTVGAGNGQGAYPVSGGTTGTLAAAADGSATIANGNPFSGSLTDSPQAGSGTLRNPSFSNTKYGPQPCDVAVALQSSTNPIPANYALGMKQMGQCYRQALLLIDPVMEGMFQNLDPNLATSMESQTLGVPQSN